jgi:hypothetical protein
MVADPDIFRAAKLLIDRHGEEAATFAAGRADLLLVEGDIDGSGVWRRILAAIEECSGEGAKTRRWIDPRAVLKAELGSPWP